MRLLPSRARAWRGWASPLPRSPSSCLRSWSSRTWSAKRTLRGPYEIDKAAAHLSTSVGVSLFPDHGSDPEALQRAADAALYRAKREGRNRTAVATEDRRPADSTGIAKSAA